MRHAAAIFPAIMVRLALGVSLVIWLGCNSVRTAPERSREPIETKNVLPVPGSRATQGSGGVLLAAEFRGMDEGSMQTACRWRVVNKDNGQNYFLSLKPSESSVYGQLDPGTYKTARLGCGLSRVWDLDDVFKDGFHIEAGKVSYVGKLIFEFKGKTLDTVRKATRLESAQAFSTAVDATPAANLPLISGFTGKPLDRKMVDADNRDGFDVYAKGIENANQSLAPLLTSLKACSTVESASDPVRFGRLEYIAVYKDGRFSEMKDRKETNAFSDHLRSCVEHGLMAYHPARKSEIEVRVRY